MIGHTWLGKNFNKIRNVFRFFHQYIDVSSSRINDLSYYKSITKINHSYHLSKESNIRCNFMLQQYQIRGFKNLKSPKPLKTKQAAAKRFIRTGKGKLKYGHSGKAHLNMGKSRVRLARLNAKGHLTGTNFKNMKKLFMYGK